MSRMDEFRLFVSKYPKIREDVKNNKYTWQSIYEDWVILGENDSRFDEYKEGVKKDDKKLDELLKNTNLKSVLEYIKKINPDTINKTLNTVEKVLQITGNFTNRPNPSLFNANYNSWWD